MDLGKKYGKMIVFLNNTQMIFYGSNIKNLAALPLKPETIHDLEIVNKDALSKEITTFIQTNKILPSVVIIVLSNALIFNKTFPPVTAQYTDEQFKKDMDLFLNYVPFQNPLNKTSVTAKGTTVIVANGDLYIGLKQVFDEQNFPVQAMIPISLLDPHAGDNFSAKIGQIALNKLDWIKQNGFIIVDPVKEDSQTPEEEYDEDDTKPKKTNKSFVLIGVVFMLLGVVAVLLIAQRNKNIPVNQAPLAKTVPDNITPTTPASLLVPSEASLSAVIQDSQTSIQILNGSGIPGQADLLRRSLVGLGFSDIQTGNSSITLAKTLIVFSPNVSPATKERIINVVKQSYPDFSTQDNSSVQTDVIITTSRPISPTQVP